jgi:hypothetical protein
MPVSNGRPEAAGVIALRRAIDASDADPQAIMARAMTRQTAGPPETLFLAWLLSLPRDLDPAEAARWMLLRFTGPQPGEGGAGRERLIELLNETTRWPSDRLACLARGERGPQREARRARKGRRTCR